MEAVTLDCAAARLNIVNALAAAGAELAVVAIARPPLGSSVAVKVSLPDPISTDCGSPPPFTLT